MMLLALAQRPELLVLDEPTDGLDPVVRRDMLAALLDYVSERGATVFISSHLVHELERMCDWIGVMDQGRLVTELPMERFKNGIKRLRRLRRAARGGRRAILAALPRAQRGRQRDLAGAGLGARDAGVLRLRGRLAAARHRPGP